MTSRLVGCRRNMRRRNMRRLSSVGRLNAGRLRTVRRLNPRGLSTVRRLNSRGLSTVGRLNPRGLSAVRRLRVATVRNAGNSPTGNGARGLVVRKLTRGSGVGRLAAFSPRSIFAGGKFVWLSPDGVSPVGGVSPADEVRDDYPAADDQVLVSSPLRENERWR